MMKQFQTHKQDFSKIRIVEMPVSPLADGEIRASVTHFSFTANNITYAVMGEKIKYWQFFPPAGDDAEQWGVIPVWGFATVTESANDEFAAGEKLFGYFPPANSVTLTPSKISPATFVDASAHRIELPAGYNLYRRVAGEPNYSPDFDNERMLLFPLFITAFCIHDMLQSNGWFNASQVIIGSASSKTSIGLAYAIADDASAPYLVGLTSERNQNQVAELGLYDEVATYPKLTEIDADQPTVIVDMSANGEVLSRLHSHLGENMRFCSNVGLTHWENAQPGPAFIRERSETFFAPGHIQQRIKDWGPEGFEQRSGKFIQRTALRSREWLQIQTLDGLAGLSDVYADVCHGRVAPDTGLIVAM